MKKIKSRSCAHPRILFCGSSKLPGGSDTHVPNPTSRFPDSSYYNPPPLSPSGYPLPSWGCPCSHGLSLACRPWLRGGSRRWIWTLRACCHTLPNLRREPLSSPGAGLIRAPPPLPGLVAGTSPNLSLKHSPLPSHNPDPADSCTTALRTSYAWQCLGGQFSPWINMCSIHSCLLLHTVEWQCCSLSLFFLVPLKGNIYTRGEKHSSLHKIANLQLPALTFFLDNKIIIQL